MNTNLPSKPRKRLLDPIERISEVLFGLIMALSFTCAMSAAESGKEEVKTMLIGAIGCNLAWGLIDGVVYLVSNLTQRAHGLAILRKLRSTTDARETRTIISDALPPIVGQVMSNDEFEGLRRKLGQISDLPAVPRLGKDDVLGAVGVFLLCFLATFPVVIPFMFMKNALEALRVSNGIALIMLFIAGYSLGRYAEHRPLRMGLSMMLLGVGLVALTIALGG